MRIYGMARVMGAVGLVLALSATLYIVGSSGTAAAVPAATLRPFLANAFWQLDITWHARDTYQDEDMNATLDMTATARFILKQSDKRADWGRWHVERADSHNLAMTGVLVSRNDGSRTEYRSNPAPPLDAGVTFEVGGATPGYRLTCSVGYPLKMTNPMLGTVDSMLNLQTTDIHGGPPVFCTGPLPASGSTIQGSLVFLAAVPPFVGSKPPFTRVGVQYVLKPFNDLAPLTR
jgi:hypothetical protein